MKNYTHRVITVDRQRFMVTTFADGHTQVSSIHPYDETEYHWARHLGGEDDFWHIYREGRFVGHAADYYDGADLSPEDIAGVLLDLDQRANLQRRGGIW